MPSSTATTLRHVFVEGLKNALALEHQALAQALEALGESNSVLIDTAGIEERHMAEWIDIHQPLVTRQYVTLRLAGETGSY